MEYFSKNLDPQEFTDAFYDSAVRQPWNAIRQLCGQEIEETTRSHDSIAGQAGQIAGTICDFMIISKLSGRAMGSIINARVDGVVLEAAAKMGVAGAIHSGIFTPSSSDRSLLLGRTENAVLGGITFGVMGGVAKGLEGRNLIGSSPLLAKSLNGALAGGFAGVPAAFGAALIRDNSLATVDELLSSVGHFAAFGAGFGALEHGLHKVTSSGKLNDGYYRAKWALQDGSVEAKRMTYSLLNRYNLRHPIQRAGDFILGSEVAADAVVPALTQANNPVLAFEKTFPEYLRRLSEFQRRYAEDPKFDPRRQQLIEAHTDFSHELLKIWHGTETRPGLAQLTDAQLATDTVPVARVEQIRRALSSSTRRNYSDPSPFEKALAELASNGEPCNFSNMSPADGFAYAKERFYGYDENAIATRMRMPIELRLIDHEYGTPVSWMPFEQTNRLPSLFHGSVSRSLDSIFVERALLPARELRLRGIEQTTGESALEAHPRRAISLTRDFVEAWAYHRHSPGYLADFPVVFGVSNAVTARAFPAGIAEPGELLINKLRVGQSLATRLGIRAPELTHIYVPDNRISWVRNMMNARRISGVNVMGFSELEPPKWNVSDTVPGDS
jgi:hypothetical protein